MMEKSNFRKTRGSNAATLSAIVLSAACFPAQSSKVLVHWVSSNGYYPNLL